MSHLNRRHVVFFIFGLLLNRFAYGRTRTAVGLPIPPLFFSRPDLNAPTLDVLLRDKRVAPGYIFVSPYFNANGHTPDSGPYIFDSAGTLIWSGIDDCLSAGISDIHGLHVCQYRKEDHLCFWKGRQKGHIYGSGVGIIMNKHYQIVRVVRAFDSFVSIDLHEFRVTPEGTALVTGYRPRLHGSIWIRDSIFREISIENGEVIFEWSALDHLDPAQSHTPAGSFPGVGTGTRNYRAWDFFHINSIDKDAEGNYLVSSRHTDTVFKVSYSDGSILWRLNGDQSDFKLENANFRRQHHARIYRETETQTTLSLFDNDNDGFIVQGETSKGILIELDHNHNTARILQEWYGPVPDMLVSDGMGSLSFLPDNSTIIGWGADSAMTEYQSDGKPVFHARIAWESRNYRAFKSAWVGEPISLPSLFTAARSYQSPAVSYASWNGATEIRSWRFYGSWKQEGPYEIIGDVPKTGFETELNYALAWPWTLVEALDWQNQTLGHSKACKTIISNAANATLESSNSHINVVHAFSTSTYYRQKWTSMIDYFADHPGWRVVSLLVAGSLMIISLGTIWHVLQHLILRAKRPPYFRGQVSWFLV